MEHLAHRQCTGKNKSGEPCGRAPIVGGTVCDFHGGKAPQTIAAAKRRLLEGVEPAIARLLGFIESPPGFCDKCGRCDDTRALIAAVKTVLDRCGLGPSATLTVRPDMADLSGLTLAELADRAELMARAARAAADAERALLLPEATDGVIVSEA